MLEELEVNGKGDITKFNPFLTDCILGVSFRVDKLIEEDVLVDAALFLLDRNDKIGSSKEDIIYFGNPRLDDRIRGNIIKRLDEEDHILCRATPYKDEEQFTLALYEIPPRIQKIKLVIGIYNPESTSLTLEHIQPIRVHIANKSSRLREDIIRVDIDKRFRNETCAVLVTLYRRDNLWKVYVDADGYRADIGSLSSEMMKSNKLDIVYDDGDEVVDIPEEDI